MNKPVKFTDAFWGGDFCSTGGYDALTKRLKEGKNTCKDVAEFFKQLSKIEHEYSQKLQQLAKTASAKDELGTLRDSWLNLKENLENISQEHQEKSNSLSSRAKEVETFIEEQKIDRKKHDDIMKKSQLNKKTAFKKVMDLKKSYDMKSKEAEDAEIVLETYKRAPQVLLKDQSKLTAKHQQKMADARKAEQLYQESVANLEHTRVSWEKDFFETCEVFQKLEENRIVNLRNELWIYTNLSSKCCVQVDQHLENTRESLEKCDEKDDIIKAAQDKQTGSDRPEEIKFEPYNSDISPNRQSNTLLSKFKLPTKSSGTMSRQPSPLTCKENQPSFPKSSGITHRERAPLPKNSAIFIPPLQHKISDDPTYDSIDSSGMNSPPKNKQGRNSRLEDL